MISIHSGVYDYRRSFVVADKTQSVIKEMNLVQLAQKSILHSGGILVYFDNDLHARDAAAQLTTLACRLSAQAYLNIEYGQVAAQWAVHLSASAQLIDITPGFDTTGISHALCLDVLNRATDLDLEILLAMARSPVAFCFPSVQELESGIRVRRFAAQAARQAELSFDTEGLERPREYWTYRPETSFTLLPDVSIIDALVHTIQPALSGVTYTFSCFRASEYILLLALALELREVHPFLHAQLEARWSRRAMMSEEFQAVFLREYGSIRDPLPLKYYVPGERIWFRNPHERSSDVMGYEGSWLYYLGAGLFNNFWKRKTPYTLVTKCLEIYHWRHGVAQDCTGKLIMDESIVEQRVEQSLRDPTEVSRIMKRMMRYRDPGGVYAQGGCIDATRESMRCLYPQTSDIIIPA